MPYDPVRDADIAPSPSAAPSPARAPSRSPAPSPHLSSRLPRHLTTPLSDRPSSSTGGRLDYPPAFSDSGARYSNSTQARQSPLDLGHPSSTLHTPHTPGPLISSTDIRAPGYFDIQAGTPAPSRMSSGMRGGLGDLLNGPSTGSEHNGYGRPRSSSSALGIGNNVTPGGESMSRSSSTSGGAYPEASAIPGSGSRSVPSSVEKRGNSLSMLLNDGPPPVASASSLGVARDPTPTPNHIPHFNRSPAFGQGRLPEILSPGTAFTQPPSLQHIPYRDHPSPGSTGPLLPQPSLEPSQQLDGNPSRVGWINSFGQGRPIGDDNSSDRPFNPAQRLISPNRQSSPRPSFAAESESGPVEGLHERRKSTVMGWSGGPVAELSARSSIDEGRGSIGGSSGRSRVSVSSIQGYDPQHAPGSPFGQGVGRIPERRNSENMGQVARLVMQPSLDIRATDAYAMPAFATTIPIPTTHVDLTSPIPLPSALMDGFTSVAPPPKQRKKSKRDIAKEAKEALASASAAEESEPTARAGGRASPSVKQDSEPTSVNANSDSNLLAAAKPKGAGKRKVSGTSATGDGPPSKSRARGRPRKDSTMVVDDPPLNTPISQQPLDQMDQTEVAKVESKPTRLAYNPINRVSPITSLLVPLTPSEAAFLQDPRNSRNPLKQAWLTAQAGKTATNDTSNASDANGRGDGNAAGQKRPRDGEDEGPANDEQQELGAESIKRARQQSPPQPHKNPASHYNARPNIGRHEREESKIVGLKKFNNWVKSVTIKKFCQRRPGTFPEPAARVRGRNKPNGRVLDIGCGKGGDMAKWDRADIGELVGVDVASKSIEDYKDRLRELRRPLCYDTSLHVLDCFSTPLTDVLSKSQLEPLFDNVSSQFCIHYAFKSVRNVRMMLENVSRYLRPGGIFFGTTVSSTKLLNYLAQVPEDAEELTIGNEYFKITFEEREHKGAFGHAYTFFLEDAIDDCVEYLVDWEEFVEIAKEYKLECVYREDFDTFYEQEKQVREYEIMAERMGVSEGGVMFMDADQWEAATIYLAFAFERRE